MNEINDNHVTGSAGEELAALYLEHEGLQILETNFRFGRGEIDLVARDGETLVFCEVKYRRTDEFGPPEYAVTPQKQRQIRRLAEGYLALRHISDQACRFDVVAICRENGLPRLNHLRNAF